MRSEHSAPEVARITELLIREEQQHAALLKGFMAAHGIPTRQHHWTDRVFRRIRKLAELEFSLGVLLTAELIGNVYYRALETVTECQRLRLLCRMMVADELAHVGFESDLLLSMRAQKPAPVRAGLDLAHRLIPDGRGAGGLGDPSGRPEAGGLWTVELRQGLRRAVPILPTAAGQALSAGPGVSSLASIHLRIRTASATRVFLPTEFRRTMTTVRPWMTACITRQRPASVM